MSDTTDILKNYYAELCFCGELPEVEVSASGTFEKIVTGEAESMIYGFNYENGRLTYQGSEALDFAGYILSNLSGEGQGDIKISYAKNGAIQEVNGGLIAASSKYKTVNASFETSLNPGDYIELFVTLTSGYGIIKIKDLKISLTKK